MQMDAAIRQANEFNSYQAGQLMAKSENRRKLTTRSAGRCETVTR
jgi:hypothetical protein